MLKILSGSQVFCLFLNSCLSVLNISKQLIYKKLIYLRTYPWKDKEGWCRGMRNCYNFKLQEYVLETEPLKRGCLSGTRLTTTTLRGSKHSHMLLRPWFPHEKTMLVRACVSTLMTGISTYWGTQEMLTIIFTNVMFIFSPKSFMLIN